MPADCEPFYYIGISGKVKENFEFRGRPGVPGLFFAPQVQMAPFLLRLPDKKGIPFLPEI